MVRNNQTLAVIILTENFKFTLKCFKRIIACCSPKRTRPSNILVLLFKYNLLFEMAVTS